MDALSMGIRDLRDELGDRVNAAHYRSEPTIITRNGEPWAVLVPYQWWAERSGEETP